MVVMWKSYNPCTSLTGYLRQHAEVWSLPLTVRRTNRRELGLPCPNHHRKIILTPALMGASTDVMAGNPVSTLAVISGRILRALRSHRIAQGLDTQGSPRPNRNDSVRCSLEELQHQCLFRYKQSTSRNMLLLESRLTLALLRQVLGGGIVVLLSLTCLPSNRAEQLFMTLRSL